MLAETYIWLDKDAFSTIYKHMNFGVQERQINLAYYNYTIIVMHGSGFFIVDLKGRG